MLVVFRVRAVLPCLSGVPVAGDSLGLSPHALIGSAAAAGFDGSILMSMAPSPSASSRSAGAPQSGLGLSYQCDPAGDTTPHAGEGCHSPLPLLERLARAAIDLRRQGSIGAAVVLEDCVAEVEASVELRALVGELKEIVATQQRQYWPLCLELQRERRVVLPGEPPAVAPPLPWEEDPQPVTRSSRDLVLSQGRAIKLLCNLYGWTRTDWGTLVKTRRGAPALSLVPDPPASPADPVDLVEAPGSIAEQAAAAAALIS